MSSVEDVCPILYELNILPNIPKCSYIATLTITLEIINETKYIELNVDPSIEIKKVQQNNEDIKYLVDTITSTLMIFSNDFSIPISIIFIGSLENDECGFFITGDHICAVFNFPFSSRTLMPCYDHPKYRCPFKLALTASEDLTKVSNMMPETTESVSGKRERITFMQTPPIPVNQFSFILGDFEFTEETTNSGYTIFFMSSPGTSETINFVKKIVTKSFNWLENFFNTPLQNDYLQIVVFPFIQTVGISNYGLIYLDYENVAEAAQNKSFKINLCVTIVSLLVLQWFGCLISPSDWNLYWSSHGFAKFLAYLILNDIKPKWKGVLSFEKMEMFDVLNSDYGSFTSLNSALSDIEEFENIFNELSIKRAACLYRMLSKMVGMDKFKLAVNSLIQSHLFKTYSFSDLVEAFSIAYESDLAPFFSSWCDQPGYPLIVLFEDNHIEQVRFCTTNKFSELTYEIPLTLRYCIDDKILENDILLDQQRLELPIPNNIKWIQIEPNHTSLCRILYKGEMHSKLIENEQQLDSISKILIRSDTIALTQMKIIPKKYIFGFVQDESIEIPKKHFPMIRGSNTILSLYIEE